MKRFLRMLAALLLAVLAPASMFASGTSTVFTSTLDPVVTAAGVFFATITALAIIVTGFFLGRKWLRSVG